MDGGDATSNIVDNKKPTSQSQTNDGKYYAVMLG